MQADPPNVSVIMPIRNEEGYIARSLRSVLDQDYPEDQIQVLIADGLSDDDTRSIVQNIAAQHPTRDIELFDNPDLIVPSAFNRALERASGDIIVRVDGHCVLARDYVRRCVELLDETGADNVGGRQQAEGNGVIARAIALATSSPFGVGDAKFHYADEPDWADTVYLGAWPRNVFERIGGFDEELVRNQDDEFNFRLRQAGGKIRFDPSIKSVYYSRTSLRKLWRQYYQYGFYKVRVMQKRGAVPSWRHLVPAAFVTSLVASLLLALATREPLWALIVAAPYAVANLAASVLAARREPRCLPQLPIAFAILHTAYGTGFLAGLWHWRHGWGSARSYSTVVLEKQKTP